MKPSLLTVGLALASLATGCATRASAIRSSNPIANIQILAFNDFHGAIDPPTGSIQQPPPEPLLEASDLQADSGLGDAEAVGRLGEAPPFDDGAEGSKLSRIHKQSLYGSATDTRA